MIHISKKIALTSLTAAALSLSGVAHAAVPGWATRTRVLDVSVSQCASTAQAVLQFLSGGQARRSNRDADNIEITAASDTARVVALCTRDAVFQPSPVGGFFGGDCDRARLTILAFSSRSRSDAIASRDVLNDAVGNPSDGRCN